MAFVARALVWLVFAAGLLLGGFAVLSGGLVAHSFALRGTMPNAVGAEALGAVFSAIVTQALLPSLLLTFASWLVLARLVPALERSRGYLALGLFVCAGIWFPIVGHYSFTMWSPRNAQDYAATLLLVAGGAALALWLPRALSFALRPGCFTAAPKRGIVAAE